jgi:hypothetical protein
MLGSRHAHLVHAVGCEGVAIEVAVACSKLKPCHFKEQG